MNVRRKKKEKEKNIIHLIEIGIQYPVLEILENVKLDLF